MRIRNKRIMAGEEEFVEDDVFEEGVDDFEGAGDVDVAEEATDLLFEAEDVAELVAEVTGDTVAVEADGDTVTFTVGEDDFIVEAEGDEEILESRRISSSKRRISASRRPATKRPVRSAARPARKPVQASTRRPVKASTRRPARRRGLR